MIGMSDNISILTSAEIDLFFLVGKGGLKVPKGAAFAFICVSVLACMCACVRIT